jgi:riboflavin synthase
VGASSFTVALIPQTRQSTTLGEAAVGRRLNVEVDILAKHIERLVSR